MPAITQECSEEQCAAPAVYRTRVKPAYCLPHVEERFRRGGLELLDEFDKPTSWQLTRCMKCGLEAHYRLEYVMDNNAHGLKTCRACFWTSWAVDSRQMMGSFGDYSPVAEDTARAHAESNGFNYIRPLTEPSLSGDPHYVRCRSCGRLSAQRLGDIGFGCSCLNSSRRSAAARPASRVKQLFKDSGSPAVSWWNHDANSEKLWGTATSRSRSGAQWTCPACDHEFTGTILDMARHPVCPQCAEMAAFVRTVERSVLATKTVFDVPDLLAAWADDADPRSVAAAGDWTARQFICKDGHRARMSPESYLDGGCPSCRGNATRAARMQEGLTLDSELASQWHPDLNTVDIAKVGDNSKRRVWWRDPECGHEWEAQPRERHKRPRWRCPTCQTRLGSLAWFYPELAAEWSPANPTSAWHVLPTGKTTFLPAWICPTDATHIWQATVASRVSGATCPECRVSGKSAVELAYRDAAIAVFGAASSGETIRDERFKRRLTWTIDIGIEVNNQPVAIEYDGSYWHRDKVALDTDKTRDLLAAGYRVVRLREDPLPPLSIDDDGYLELTAFATSPDTSTAMTEIARWLTR
ncbi:zinc-ribbon domain-containing protein [Microbacterium sp. NPDC057658]|uniref:zinc-ribbon domain-containing protein n=1 Tax=unclassified Microbacterium TaxID=2609290 RepID=UPI00366F492D